MRTLLRINVVLTAGFLLATLVAAITFNPTTRALGVITCLALFSVGVASFIWGYFSAVQRSRTHEISVAALYFLTGSGATTGVKQIMIGCLIAQLLIGLGGAIARSSTNGRSGSTLAFGVLVPLLGLGFNGLWASHWGTFTPREQSDRQG